MRTHRDNAMSDPSPSPLARVHVVSATSQESAEPATRPEPLQITYSTTRVLPDALVRLQRHAGVVKGDRSELAETFKMLRNQLLLRMRADGHRVLAVTSPRAMEGKSLTAVNLALTLAADHDTAVLLIDADLAQHGVQRLFGLEGQPGLGEHLSTGASLVELFINPGVDRLVLLPAGAAALPNSAELLAAKAAQHLIDEVKQRYSDRYIVVDLPPLLETADTLAFLPHVDTTLIVVEDHVTTQADVERATELMAPFNLVGTVISRARPKVGQGESAVRVPWYRRWLVRGAARA